MNKLVLDILTSEARQSSQIYHALLFKGIDNFVRESENFNPTLAKQLLTNLLPLQQISIKDIIKDSTPFFWFNVHRLYNLKSREQEKFCRTSCYLAMLAFDAFYHYLPNGTTVKLTNNDEFNIVLPNLRINIHTSNKNVILHRLTATEMIVELEKQDIHLNLQNLDSAFRLPTFNVFPNRKYPVVLLFKDSSLFDDHSYKQITTENLNVTSFTKMLSEALKLITEVDPSLGNRITSLAKWYVPIGSPDPRMHCSFTSFDLRGVLFLSEALDDLVLAEAVVHEFGHTELNTLMDTQSLIHEDSLEKYYSPWRKDPRPLVGLFHAIYVFSQVANFLITIEKLSLVTKKHDLKERILLICYRLKIAIYQVPYKKLTPIGRNIIELISEWLNKNSDGLHDLENSTFRLIIHHLKLWHNNNPDYALFVKIPTDIQSHL